LFGNKEASGIVLLKTFDEYYGGYKDGDKEVT
jgi:type I restriction enzyme R subunit